jgi:hypothetical protein
MSTLTNNWPLNSGVTASLSFTVPIPDAVAGRLLVGVATTRQSTDAPTVAGWTQVISEWTAAGVNSGLAVYVKIADGNDDFVSSVTTTSARWSCIVWELDGGGGVDASSFTINLVSGQAGAMGTSTPIAANGMAIAALSGMSWDNWVNAGDASPLTVDSGFTNVQTEEDSSNLNRGTASMALLSYSTTTPITPSWLTTKTGGTGIFGLVLIADAAPQVPPTVDAKGPYFGTVSTPIALDADGFAGTDPDPDILWTIDTANTGTFGDATAVDTTFIPDEVGAYTLRLTVTPDDGPPVISTAELTSVAADAFWELTNIGGLQIVDGSVNVSELTTAGAIGTALGEAQTLASGEFVSRWFIKQITGAGTVEITLDGTSWVDVTSLLNTSTYTEVMVGATLANPQIGIQVGDSTVVYVQNAELLVGQVISNVAGSDQVITADASTQVYQPCGDVQVGAWTAAGWQSIGGNSHYYPMDEGSGNTFFDDVGTDDAAISNEASEGGGWQ